ncbi:MAG TPA: DUF4232 domain-containing protein [Solirubrobacteraceae bacterium]
MLAVVLAVGVALALGGCGSAGSSSSSSTASPATSTTTVTATASQSSASASSAPATGTSTATPGCATPNLRLTRISGQGAAGTAYFYYGLQNVGSGRCSLIGYPGVSILDAQGNIVQHPAKRGTSIHIRVRLISLAPGQRAKFLVTSSDVIPSPGCTHQYRGTTLQVFPPNQRAALRLPDSTGFCNLRVGAVQRS